MKSEERGGKSKVRNDLRQRTFEFAVRVVNPCRELHKTGFVQRSRFSVQGWSKRGILKK